MRDCFALLLRGFIKRQRVAVYPAQGVFVAEIPGKDDQLDASDATKYFACFAVTRTPGYNRKTRLKLTTRLTRALHILEKQLQRELDLPRGGGRLRNLAGRFAIVVAGGVARENHLIREPKIGAIENIERFRPELQRHALLDGDPLEQGSVDVEQGWAANRATPRVSEGAGNRHLVGTGIEPVYRCPQITGARKSGFQSGTSMTLLLPVPELLKPTIGVIGNPV